MIRHAGSFVIYETADDTDPFLHGNGGAEAETPAEGSFGEGQGAGCAVIGRSGRKRS